MINIILGTVGLTAIIIATIVDIKKREVPDWISYSLIASGFGIRVIDFLTTNNWHTLLYGAAGFTAMLAVGMFMYYTRQWGGGDAKLILGIGTVFADFGTNKLFLLDFLINMLLIGAAYGLAFGLILAIKKWKEFKPEIQKIAEEYRKIRLGTLGGAAITIIIILLIQDNIARTALTILALFSLTYMYLMLFMKAVDKACMYKYVPTKKLTEGDWVAEEVKINNKVICGPKDLGLEKNQIEELKRLKVKKVLIKEGIPFVPSFLIAMIITLIAGNMIMKIV